MYRNLVKYLAESCKIFKGLVAHTQCAGVTANGTVKGVNWVPGIARAPNATITDITITLICPLLLLVPAVWIHWLVNKKGFGAPAKIWCTEKIWVSRLAFPSGPFVFLHETSGRWKPPLTTLRPVSSCATCGGACSPVRSEWRSAAGCSVRGRWAGGSSPESAAAGCGAGVRPADSLGICVLRICAV